MEIKRIAMWSGPRNISTAMMRSWGNRPDTVVIDEPLYAHYLQETGREHPGAAKIIACYETDWRTVVKRLIESPLPEGKTIFYQKHMAHHFLPNIEMDWVKNLVNCFLIREPREMLFSLIRFLPEPHLQDTGLREQKQLFDFILHHTGNIPPVLDARDVLENPRGILTKLCEYLEIPFMESMLQWSPGHRSSDGIWAKYWYGTVEKSTGFEPYRPRTEPLPERLLPLLEECNEIYLNLYQYRLHV